MTCAVAMPTISRSGALLATARGLSFDVGSTGLTRKDDVRPTGGCDTCDMLASPPRISTWPRRRLLRRVMPGLDGEPVLERISGGNRTRLISELPTHRTVLRMPPKGPLLPSAHAWTVNTASCKLWKTTNVPVPQMLALCTDPGVTAARLRDGTGRGPGVQRLFAVRRRPRRTTRHVFCDGRNPGPVASRRLAAAEPTTSAASAATTTDRSRAGRSSGRCRRPATIPDIGRLIVWLGENVPDESAHHDQPRRLSHRH